MDSMYDKIALGINKIIVKQAGKTDLYWEKLSDFTCMNETDGNLYIISSQSHGRSKILWI